MCGFTNEIMKITPGLFSNFLLLFICTYVQFISTSVCVCVTMSACMWTHVMTKCQCTMSSPMHLSPWF